MLSTGKALAIGINAYPDGHALYGCVNDTARICKTWDSIGATNHKVLLDKDATTQGMRDALAWLVADIQPGEYCYFHFSGHGVQIPGDDPDGLCEAICPVDFSWSPDQCLTDKDLHKIFWELPDDVRFYWSSDSCHSGDLTRTWGTNQRCYGRWIGLKHPRPVSRLMTEERGAELDVGFVSACKSDQVASDTVIMGVAAGAFTSCFCDAIEAKNDSIIQITKNTIDGLKAGGWGQEPQCQGKRIKLAYGK